ncbi:MAG: Coenzyme F420 hydrogenase/dehydrogenase, beta subunit C-terminal domain [Candidatus Bathyarchaeia archaeon]
MPEKPKIFGTLNIEVVNTGLCMYCGTCIASCPVNVISYSNEEKPVLKGICALCELCYYSCPRVELPINEVEIKIFNRERSQEERALGIFKAAYAAKATDPEILKASQDGGVATTLLLQALEDKIVDYAIVTGVDKEKAWKPTPLIISRRDEVLKAAGSKYSPGASVGALGDAGIGYPERKFAYVGMPCQIDGIRRMQTSSKGNKKLGEKVNFTIGLFCFESYRYLKLFEEYIQNEQKINLSEITKVDIKNNILKLYEGEKIVYEEPVKNLKNFIVSGCNKCQDFTGELADVSIGAVGAPEKWCAVLTRTEIGEKIFKRACETGKLEAKPLDESGLKIIARISEKKKQREAPYIKFVLTEKI